jgi:nucleotide-binding universal stress UspA family protein
MFRNILVPLDGSKLAECALPYAEEIAKCCNAERVVLVSVTERVEGYRPLDDPSQPLGQRLMPEAVGKKAKPAEKYLDRIASALKANGVKVQTEVLLGDPAKEITLFAKHREVDLIVMSSHGRSGPSRLAFGSVADKVFRSTNVPVLMVRAPGCGISI